MPRKLLNAGDMRHRVTIQERIETQNPTTGAISWTWETVNDERGNWSNIPAQKLPLSAREFEAAATTQAQTSCRWVLRWMAGITAKMRLLDLLNDSAPYNINGLPLEDLNTGRQYITLSTTAGVNEG